MTPEERARAVVMPWWHGPYQIHNFDQTIADIEIHDIAAAIRAAMAAEREACAQLMDEMWADASPGEAIRARTAGNS